MKTKYTTEKHMNKFRNINTKLVGAITVIALWIIIFFVTTSINIALEVDRFEAVMIMILACLALPTAAIVLLASDEDKTTLH